MEFENALGVVKMIKDQIQYWSQSLLNSMSQITDSLFQSPVESRPPRDIYEVKSRRPGREFWPNARGGGMVTLELTET